MALRRVRPNKERKDEDKEVFGADHISEHARDAVHCSTLDFYFKGEVEDERDKVVLGVVVLTDHSNSLLKSVQVREFFWRRNQLEELVHQNGPVLDKFNSPQRVLRDV